LRNGSASLTRTAVACCASRRIASQPFRTDEKSLRCKRLRRSSPGRLARAWLRHDTRPGTWMLRVSAWR